MPDITSTNLEAAILDQKVAGVFRDKRYAFVSVPANDGWWALGIAVQDEQGYNPIDGKKFATRDEAYQWADSLNEHIGHKPNDIARIVASTMRRPVR